VRVGPRGYTHASATPSRVAHYSPNRCRPHAPARQELTPESLEPLLLLEEEIELLILGCGPQLTRMGPELAEWARRHSVRPEMLATGTACATFNFMVQEQRPVAAVLFPAPASRHVESPQLGPGSGSTENHPRAARFK